MTSLISYPIGVGDITTRVIEAGSGDQVVVFVHGVGARADRWKESVRRYSEAGYRCLAFDLPGHGFATKGDAPDYSVASFSKLLLSLMVVLGINKAALVGTSLGGYVAAHAAVEAPEMVSSLVLVGTLGITALPATGLEGIRHNIVRTARSDVGEKLRYVVADASLVTESWIEEEWRINNSPGAIEAFRKLGDYLVNRSNDDLVGQRLASLIGAMPTCLVWGVEDVAVPLAIGEECVQVLQGADLYCINKAGHAPYLERPSDFDQVVLPFLYKNTAS